MNNQHKSYLEAILNFLSIIGTGLGIFGFLWHLKHSKDYTWKDVEEWGKKYIVTHPQYYEEKRVREIQEDEKRGMPSAPTDTPFEDVFIKSRNRNRRFAIACVISGLSLQLMQSTFPCLICIKFSY